jgi:hypothetical protein
VRRLWSCDGGRCTYLTRGGGLLGQEIKGRNKHIQDHTKIIQWFNSFECLYFNFYGGFWTTLLWPYYQLFNTPSNAQPLISSSTYKKNLTTKNFVLPNLHPPSNFPFQISNHLQIHLLHIAPSFTTPNPNPRPKITCDPETRAAPNTPTAPSNFLPNQPITHVKPQQHFSS